MYFQQSKYFWKGYNTAWLFQDEFNSNHTMLTAILYSVQELNQQVCCSLLYMVVEEISSRKKFCTIVNANSLSFFAVFSSRDFACSKEA